MSTNQSRSQASGGFILLQVFVICVVLFTTLAIVMQYVVGLSASVRDRTDLSTAQTAAAAGQDGLVYCMKKYPNFRPDNPNYFSKKSDDSYLYTNNSNGGDTNQKVGCIGNKDANSIVSDQRTKTIFSALAEVNGKGYAENWTRLTTTSFGQVQRGSIFNKYSLKMDIPTAVRRVPLVQPNSLSVGKTSACGTDIKGQAYCWGLNNKGILGNDTTVNSTIPIPVDTTGHLSGKKLVNISVGSEEACALDTEGKAYCWGFGPPVVGGKYYIARSILTPTPIESNNYLKGKILNSWLFLKV